MALTEPTDVSSGDIIFATLWNTFKSLLFDAIGNQVYTDDNYVADDASSTSNIDALDIQAKKADIGNTDYLKGFLTRPKFLWKDADEIYIDPGVYDHRGTSSQACMWNSRITFVLGSAGSNSASSNLGNDEFHYIYIDDSAVVTAGTNILTALEFLNSTTAPTWSNTKHGWYNGNDRCILGVRTDGSGNVLEFFNDGRKVIYAESINNYNSTPGGTWTDIPLTIPGFATTADVLFIIKYVDQYVGSYWRTKGQANATGHFIGYTENGVPADKEISAQVCTDSTQQIQVKFSSGTNNIFLVNTNGFFLPAGM